MKRLSDADIEVTYNRAFGLANPSGHLQSIQIELQLRIIEKLEKIYGATH